VLGPVRDVEVMGTQLHGIAAVLPSTLIWRLRSRAGPGSSLRGTNVDRA
jgi:hypothetical protein